ncbi:MAG: HAD-IA family hydrolase [Planctomycetota bacterium]|jgi:2-haloacid dehalogenase
MSTVKERLQEADTLTFDCYGTLIDWRGGIESSLLQILGPAIMPSMYNIFDEYVRAEKEVESETYRRYSDVLADTIRKLGERMKIPVSDEQARALPHYLTQWSPFPDTVEALTRLKSRYRLGILSNIDRDLFAETNKQLQVEFDFIVTAEDVGTYKPHHGHFRQMLTDHAEKGRVVHVAQSLFHDAVPAGQLGLACVWINRYNEKNESAIGMTGEFPDLASLADAADI